MISREPDIQMKNTPFKTKIARLTLNANATSVMSLLTPDNRLINTCKMRSSVLFLAKYAYNCKNTIPFAYIPSRYKLEFRKARVHDVTFEYFCKTHQVFHAPEKILQLDICT